MSHIPSLSLNPPQKSHTHVPLRQALSPISPNVLPLQWQTTASSSQSLKADITVKKPSQAEKNEEVKKEEQEAEIICYDSLAELFNPLPLLRGSCFERLQTFIQHPNPSSYPFPRLTSFKESDGKSTYRAFIKLHPEIDRYFDLKVEDKVWGLERGREVYTETFHRDSIQVPCRYLKVWLCNDDADNGYNQSEHEALFIIRIQEDNICELCHLKAKEFLSGNYLYSLAHLFVDLLAPESYYLHDASKKSFANPFGKKKLEVTLRHILPLSTGKTWYEKMGMQAVDFFETLMECDGKARSQDSRCYHSAWQHLRNSPLIFIQSMLDKYIVKKGASPLYSLATLAQKYNLNFSSVELESLAKVIYQRLRQEPENTDIQKDLSQLYVNYLTSLQNFFYEKVRKNPNFVSKLPEEERLYFLALDTVWNTIIFKESREAGPAASLEENFSQLVREYESWIGRQTCLVDERVQKLASSHFSKRKESSSFQELCLAKKIKESENKLY